MTIKQAKQISKILEEVDINVHEDEIKDLESTDEVRDFLSDNDYLDEEVIYYSTAMEYLSENDNSLTESMALAQDMGYEPKNINSELLASLLKSQELKNDFEEQTNEIDEVLS